MDLPSLHMIWHHIYNRNHDKTFESREPSDGHMEFYEVAHVVMSVQFKGQPSHKLLQQSLQIWSNKATNAHKDHLAPLQGL